MTFDELRQYPLCYLASPYSLYPYGFEVAFRSAAAITARLLLRGLNVFSPIVHGHPLSIHGGVDPTDISIWDAYNEALMIKADALLVAQMEGWNESKGIAGEIEWFTVHCKPIHHLHPVTLKIVT